MIKENAPTHNSEHTAPLDSPAHDFAFRFWTRNLTEQLLTAPLYLNLFSCPTYTKISMLRNKITATPPIDSLASVYRVTLGSSAQFAKWV
jgi:hypothetical protein